MSKKALALNMVIEIIIVLIGIIIVLVLVFLNMRKTGTNFFTTANEMSQKNIDLNKVNSYCSAVYSSDTEKQMIDRINSGESPDGYLSFLVYPPLKPIQLNFMAYNEEEKAVIVQRILGYCSLIENQIRLLESNRIVENFITVTGDGSTKFPSEGSSLLLKSGKSYCVECQKGGGVKLVEGVCPKSYISVKQRYLLYYFPLPGSNQALYNLAFIS